MRQLEDVLGSFKVLGVAILIASLGPAWASGAVECKVVCSDGKQCKTSDRPAVLKTALSLSDCELSSRKIEAGCADVYYHSRRTVQLARVCTNASISAALREPDRSCGSFWSCLMPLPPKPVAAGSPIGEDDQSSSSSGAKAGLPFNIVLMPSGPLRLSAAGSGAPGVGKLSLWDASSNRIVATIPIEAGVAVVPLTSIAPEGNYRYQWEAGPQVLEGTFLTTSVFARTELEAAVASSTLQMTPEARQLRMVSMLANEGYAWDAMQTTILVDRTQETLP